MSEEDYSKTLSKVDLLTENDYKTVMVKLDIGWTAGRIEDEITGRYKNVDFRFMKANVSEYKNGYFDVKHSFDGLIYIFPLQASVPFEFQYSVLSKCHTYQEFKSIAKACPYRRENYLIVNNLNIDNEMIIELRELLNHLILLMPCAGFRYICRITDG